ncbi:Hpt domain-containing protein [uncultured Croceitalea sp.]|uniref:Hpt domain-containing protein n=1 Tax=uncultured Croceitalea sp. TaxID=1798908 RepID=UPI00374F37E0
MSEAPNLKYLDKLAGDDIEFRQKFIDILKEEFPDEQEEYNNNVGNMNYREASENVHKIKHKLNILGLDESHSLAVRYEFELRNGANSLAEQFQAILKNVENYLNTI